jgi:CDP-glucose 4,6-dehydratase
MDGKGQPNAAFWRGRSVFLTGHTGFVGGWLALWLSRMGARVTGYSLAPPTKPSFFESIGEGSLVSSTIADIRDADRLGRAIAEARPDIIFHLAAQPLVGAAFFEPRETWSTNVMGTANVLEGARALDSLQGLIVFTTDKVYADSGKVQRFREDDPLGGSEAYALSKAAAEFIVSAYRHSQFMRDRGPLGLVTVRAGNIVGGGDWGADRLVPDAIRAFEAGIPLMLRKPDAIRPWQFVLDAACGLLLVAEAACRDPQGAAGGWNLGPAETAVWTVAQMADLLVNHWGKGASWQPAPDHGTPETLRLEIDSHKAAKQLGWRTVWPMDATISETIAWYRAFFEGEDMVSISTQQIERHFDRVGGRTSQGARR